MWDTWPHLPKPITLCRVPQLLRSGCTPDMQHTPQKHLCGIKGPANPAEWSLEGEVRGPAKGNLVWNVLSGDKSMKKARTGPSPGRGLGALWEQGHLYLGKGLGRTSGGWQH